MEIKQVVIKPYEKAITPALSIEVEIAYTKLQEAIIGVEGFLESDDGKIIANLAEIASDQPKTSGIGAKDSNQDSEFKETVNSSTLIAFLEREALDYIEKRRAENKKGDIFLSLNLNVQSIVTTAKISHFHDIDSQSAGIPSQVNVLSSSGRRITGRILAYGHDSQFSTSFSNLWILSGDGGPVFLCVNRQSIRYCPNLGELILAAKKSRL